MVLAALLSLALSSAAALSEAGSLDGRWCSPDGRRVAVSGLAVITPAGREVTGRYSKEAFSFVMPESEWDGGKTIWMELKTQNSARVSVQSQHQEGPPPHDLWTRCEEISHVSGTPRHGQAPFAKAKTSRGRDESWRCTFRTREEFAARQARATVAELTRPAAWRAC